jgi:hypothetical protein
MTVAELLKTLGIPLHVWMWLERYAGGDKHALHPNGNDDDPAVVHTARLVYDVLDSKHKETGTGTNSRYFPEETRDFVEEWLYKLTRNGDFHVWNDADLAVAALPMLLLQDGIILNPKNDPTYTLLRTVVERTTTRRERRAFLRDEEGDAPDSEEDKNWNASFKLSRLLADPRTTPEARREIQERVIELCNAANIIVDHPAIVRRAFLVACEQHPKGQARELKRARRNLLALLDSIPDAEGGAS